MVMCLLNHSKAAEAVDCQMRELDNCAACKQIDSSCEADDGFSANSSFDLVRERATTTVQQADRLA